VLGLNIGDVEGLVGGDGPVLVELVGELGLGGGLGAELSRVVHGGLVGEHVLATGDDAGGVALESLGGLLGVDEVPSELVSVLELLLIVGNDATGLSELVGVVVAEPVLVALVLLDSHDFAGLEVLGVVLSGEADEDVLLSVVETDVDGDVGVAHGEDVLLVLPLGISRELKLRLVSKLIDKISH
jgi:hypothetical protein